MVEFVAELHLLAKKLANYMINLTSIGFCCCCSPADLGAEGKELVALTWQQRMLTNLELDDTGLHFEYTFFCIHQLSSSKKISQLF